MSIKDLDKVKMYFKKGIYKLAQINAMLSAGKITEEEYRYIVGENT